MQPGAQAGTGFPEDAARQPALPTVDAGTPVIPLLRACHLPPTLAVTAFTAAIALASGRRWGALPVGAAALAGQLTVGWSNDYIDRDRDRAAGRLDKPIVAGEVDATLVRNGALLAGAACVPLSLLSGWRAAAIHGTAVAAALGYNIRLKGTAASVAPYVVAFGSLPAFVTMAGRHGHRPPVSATLAAALMGAGAHFVNTLPDLESDESVAVRGLPHRLGRTGSLLTGVGLLAAATAVVVRAGDRAPGRAGVVLTRSATVSILGVFAAAAAKRERVAWTLSLVTSAATVGVYLTKGDLLAPRVG